VTGKTVATVAANLAAGAETAIEAADRTECGGPLTFGEIVKCPSIVDSDRDVFTVTATVDQDMLYATLGRSTGTNVTANATADVTDSAGEFICYLTNSPTSCELGAAGVYFSSPGVTGLPPAGSADRCLTFEQPTGSLLYLEVSGGGNIQGQILDGQYQPLCPVRYSVTCSLNRAGPYRLFLQQFYGDQANYTLRMPRISHSEGCAAVRPGPFGDQGSLVGGGTASAHITCNKLTARAPGPVVIRFSPSQSLPWTLYDNAGQKVCEKYYNARSCRLPAAGDYTLLVSNDDIGGGSVDYQVGVTELFDPAGCASVTGTSWDLPALLVHQTSAVQVNCHAFQGNAGDRIITYASPTVYNWAFASLIDSTGAAVCSGYSSEDGCVLPAAGAYRVVTNLDSWDAQSSDATYKLQIRRLSATEGCPPVAPGAYNAAPAGTLGGIRCRVLDIPAAGAYRFRTVDAENYQQYSQVYTSTGLKLSCGTVACTFPTAGRYLMVLSGSTASSVIDVDFEYAVALLPVAPSGCRLAEDDPAALVAQHGQFEAAGQYDCLRLASPAKTKVVELLAGNSTDAGRPEVTVVDATGGYVCDSVGTAPAIL
jgi:hypothetical protein